MKIRYVNSIGDLIALARHHASHSTTHRVLLLLLRWVLPGMMLVLVLPPLLAGRATSLYWAILPVALMLGARWLRDTLNGLLIRARHREGNNKGVLGPHELELSPPDLIERTPVNEQATWLGAIEKVATTPTHAFIFLNSYSAHVIPRDGVTDGDFEAFVETVRREAENAEWVRSRRPFGGEAAPRTAEQTSGGDERISPA